jgi:hypothetical protein
MSRNTKTNNIDNNNEEGKEKKVAATIKTKKGTLNRFFSENFDLPLPIIIP